MRVEAARMGAIFASGKAGQKAYSRWRTRLDHAAGRSRGLTGAHLEAAVMGLAATNPEYVVMGA